MEKVRSARSVRPSPDPVHATATASTTAATRRTRGWADMPIQSTRRAQFDFFGQSRQPSGSTKGETRSTRRSAGTGLGLRPGVFDDLQRVAVGVPEAGEPGVAFDLALVVEID